LEFNVSLQRYVFYLKEGADYTKMKMFLY